MVNLALLRYQVLLWFQMLFGMKIHRKNKNKNKKKTKQKKERKKERKNKQTNKQTNKTRGPISEGEFELQYEAAILQCISDFVLFVSLASNCGAIFIGC